MPTSTPHVLKESLSVASDVGCINCSSSLISNIMPSPSLADSLVEKDAQPSTEYILETTDDVSQVSAILVIVEA